MFGNIESLSGYKVAQISDFSITEFLRTNHPDITITEVTSAEEAVEKVSSGQADAYISTISSGVAAITKAGVTNVIVSGNASSYKAGDAIATRMEPPLLASALQKALTSIVSRQNKLD